MTVQPDRVSIDIGGRLQSDYFKKVDTPEAVAKNLCLTIHRFSRKTTTLTVMFFRKSYDESFWLRREPEKTEPVSETQNQQSQ